MTPEELDRAIERLKSWPDEDRTALLLLPKKELEVALLLISELDAQPEKS